MGIDSFLGKKYKLQTSENFDEFMKALGVGLITRKMGNTVSPVVELVKSEGGGEEMVLTSSSTFKNVVTKFTPGIEFENDTPDGRKVHSTFTIDSQQDGLLSEKQRTAEGKITTIDRYFTDDEIKMVCKVDDIVCTRIYKLQA